MVLACKKAGISDEDFRAYYRDRHLPFMHGLLTHGAAFHRRNFVVHAGGPQVGYHVITEALYEDETVFAKTLEELSDPEKRRLRMEDEARFLDPDSIRIFRVEAEETSFRQMEHCR